MARFDLGLSCYKQFLFSMNKHRGDKRWWLVFTAALVVMLLWGAFGVPVLMPMPDVIGRYDWVSGSFTLWSVLTIPRQNQSMYYAVMFLVGIPLVKAAWTVAEFSYQFARGRRFVYQSPGGILDGDWVAD